MLLLLFAYRSFADDAGEESGTETADTKWENLPEVFSWQDGQGLDKDGTILADTWAYDMVNAAGKYVLFDEAGAVIRRQDKAWEESLSEDYTSTDAEPGIFMLRCTVPDDFSGAIQITFTEKSGCTYTYDLNEENLYAGNLAVPEGSYTVSEAAAKSGTEEYAVSFSEETFEIESGAYVLVNLGLETVAALE